MRTGAAMHFLLQQLPTLPQFQTLDHAVKAGLTPALATGLSGIHKALLCAGLLCHNENCPSALLLCGDEAEAQRLYDDLNAFGVSALFYPARDFNFRDIDSVSREYEHQRLQVLSRLLSGECQCVVACIDGALQYTIPPKELQCRTLPLTVGQEIAMEEIVETLVRCGYERAEQIDGTGQFSVRGGILDFFPPDHQLPVRLEFWGDTIDSMTDFDLTTQRRVEPLQSVWISPSSEVLIAEPEVLAKKLEQLAASLRGKQAPKAKAHLLSCVEKLQQNVRLSCVDTFLPLLYPNTATLFDYFPAQSLVFFSDEQKQKERLRNNQWQWSEDCKDLLEEGVLCRGLTTFSEDWTYALSQGQRRCLIFLDAFARGSSSLPLKTLVNINARQLSPWSGSVTLLCEDLESMLAGHNRCVLLAGNEKAANNLTMDLQNKGLPAIYADSPTTLAPNTVTVTSGVLSAGFELPEMKLSVITYRHAPHVASPRKTQKAKHTQALYSLSDLTPGDYVVHTTHGVGIFQGIHKIEMQGITKDYIKVQYAKKDTLYVPVTQLDMVAKYIGPREDSLVKLNKLGSNDWQKSKARVRTAVKDMAKELIKLYAARMNAKGHAFSPDTEYQRDFESHFPYEETSDQLRCIQEIKGDMEATAPMDRLLCGDVGFGKTEVALRAAFKCVSDSLQCAILVPTTILAWQHYQTLCKRMEDFPVNIELLSRFRTPKQQAEILKKLERGEIDIVVGTHRLVSKDVKFRRLGLVIIDEEQRFGVAQKEKLKTMCKNIDVLTLSATPIPRTLNMALSGIRDMSIIEEAPQDRHPVQTYVLEYDKGILCDAIRKELRRGGQVYYLHNNVETIEQTAAALQEAIPEAVIGVAHGKMNEAQLSEVWRKLLEQEIDVLVCTTIIETGVDIPNANTLIIENADRMGLSQLHQIRGRVGRSSRRAYAYLTFQRSKVLSEIAQKRLTAIREFTEFGSGFKIAMRDLEIRGAGNILGGEQHGHMESVGYDLYLKLLAEAIQAEKGEEVQMADEECLVDVQMEAHIPEWYISSLTQRLEIYRRIADIRSEEDALDVTDELTDRFGKVPEAVKGLIEVALLRNMAAALHILEVKQQGDALLLYPAKVDMAQVEKLIKALHGRVSLSTGAKSFIRVRMRKDSKPLPYLRELLTILSN
ncbi:MAG: transcription-repair coupling factor [Oscillospiraceae bacterium]|nr:transcription-repair coupling factor [Oscillospiraceae bacterium]